MTNQIPYISYLLQFADNALIHGQRLAEWTGHAAVLEQDIALTNISLDQIGQARSFYQYAAEKINQLPVNESGSLFKAPLLTPKLGSLTEDDLAFLRDAWDFKNLLLLEQPNGDWDTTLVKSFYYDHFIVLIFEEILQNSTDLQLKAIVEKSLKESLYHRRWSSEWIIRMGDGTDFSHDKVQTALLELLPYTGEMFETSKSEELLNETGQRLDLEGIQKQWFINVNEILDKATLNLPDEMPWMQSGGKNGIHSEHLGFMLAEMQFMQRSYPNMEW